MSAKESSSESSQLKKRQGLGRLLPRAATLFLIGLLLIIASHEWMHSGLMYSALHETGFALLVSVIVWLLFEHQINNENEDIWDTRMERLSNNVFQAVLRKDLPKGLIDEANNLVLNNPIVRSNFSVTYSLSDHHVSDIDPCMDAVIVKAVMEYDMVNVSTDVFNWDVQLALPNPIHRELQTLLVVPTVKVSKGGVALELDQSKAESAFQGDLSQSKKSHIVYKAGVVTLNPGEKCSVSMSYVMVKEAEDSELLQTLYPAESLRVTVFDGASPQKRSVFADAVHRHELQETSSSSHPSARIFKISGYLLPHQGILIWWKKHRSEGNPALPAQPAAAKAPQSEGARA